MNNIALYFALFSFLALIFVYKHAQRMEKINNEKLFNEFNIRVSKYRYYITDFELLAILSEISKFCFYSPYYSNFEISIFLIMNRNENTRIIFDKFELLKMSESFKNGHQIEIPKTLYSSKI